MKRFILCISCLLICCLFLLPEVQAAIPDTGNWISHHLLTSDGLTVLAAGPAFAPLNGISGKTTWEVIKDGCSLFRMTLLQPYQ